MTAVDVDSPDKATRILEAADELFGGQGYAGVSVRDVAQRAGVNKALVFYYFRSKEALFEQVLQRYYTAHQVALEGAAAPGMPPVARFHRVVDAYLDFIEEHRLYPRLIQQQLTGSGPQMDLVKRALAPLFHWTEGVLADIAPDHGPLAARHFFVTVQGAVINYFTYGPVLEAVWGGDPLTAVALAERREHLHWLVDALLERLERDRHREF